MILHWPLFCHYGPHLSLDESFLKESQSLKRDIMRSICQGEKGRRPHCMVVWQTLREDAHALRDLLARVKHLANILPVWQLGFQLNKDAYNLQDSLGSKYVFWEHFVWARPRGWSIFRAMQCRWSISQQRCDTDYFWKSLTSPSLRLFSLTIGNNYFSIILLILGPIILGLFTDRLGSSERKLY